MSEIDTTWHGSKQDLNWYELYKSNSVKVKTKNHSGIGGQPRGTYTIRSMKKVSPSKADFTINFDGGQVTASVDLDNPQMVVDKKYDTVLAFKFYSGDMPITARQAFNLFQIRSTKDLIKHNVSV